MYLANCNLNMPLYHFNDHRHNYAVWTAARAVQRGFTVTTATIREAIEKSGLREFAEDNKPYNHTDFEVFHLMCAYNLMDSFKSKAVNNISYGRAAKIIAVYLKTAVVLCSKGACHKSQVIHPPLDRILLQNLAKNVAGLEKLAMITWTGLNADRYWKIAELIKEQYGSFNWQLEEYWEV
jgi:hypothetical protein